MKILVPIFILVACSCTREQPKLADTLPMAEHSNRYGITLIDVPVVFSNVEVLTGNAGQWPFIWLLSKTGEIYEDDNARFELSLSSERSARKGLGPSFKFNRVYPTQEDAAAWFEKGSIKISYDSFKMMADRTYNIEEPWSDYINVDHPTNFFSCNLSWAEGLKCQVKCSSNELSESCPIQTIWHNLSDPIIEVKTRGCLGIYAMSQDGKLIYTSREFRRLKPTQILHNDLKFLRNKTGRYFINSNSDSVCLQSDELDIYCLDMLILHKDASQYGLTNEDQPNLAKLTRTNFPVQEVALSARHYCVLSDKGEAFCAGDNGCGQITGRHDGIQEFTALQKMDLLGPAKQLFTYAGGTCALLIDGRLQCFGLGSSVIRTRLLPDDYYERSFSWLHGFRPWQHCAGGAENGI